MEITPLELGLAVIACFIIFGPKELPSFKKNDEIVVQAPPMTRYELAQYEATNYAAGRAASPLQQKRGRSLHDASPSYQFAMADVGQSPDQWRPAPLPHELPKYS